MYKPKYKPKKTAKNCRNCSYRKDDNDRKIGWCYKFKITISDNTNARLCKGFKNKHEKRKSN